jgi:YVTN family beta-propeller protein
MSACSRRSVAWLLAALLLALGSSVLHDAPRPVGAASGGPYAYVANNGDATVSVITTSTNSVGTTVPVGRGPLSLGRFICPLLLGPHGDHPNRWFVVAEPPLRYL